MTAPQAGASGDSPSAEEVLAAVATAAGRGAILWRGPDLGGSDIDVVVLPAAEAAVAGALRAAGCTPEARAQGRAMWSTLDGSVKVDVLPARAWPAAYPSLAGLGRRALPERAGLPPVASKPDRLLVFAADALAGRPLAKLLPRLRALRAQPGVFEEAREVAEGEGMAAVADLVADLDAVEGRARRGRLPYTAAVGPGIRSRRARSALAGRARARSAGLARLAMGRARRARRGRLVALSGMDGAGKSSAAVAARDELEAAGLSAEVAWARLGREDLRDRIAAPVKRLLRHRGTVADPVASFPAAERPQDRYGRPPRRTLVAWAWVPVVAAVAGHGHRRAAEPRRTGTNVVCDRWLVDSLVDLRVRYGRHRLAEWILRVATPRPDLSVLLDIDAEVSARRKPGDQVERVLREMEGLYRAQARSNRLELVDARAPLAEVEREVRALVREMLR